jgi:hypothetical protein
MIQKKSNQRKSHIPSKGNQVAHPKIDSLVDAMEDGNEYGSIVGAVPKESVNLIEEVRRTLKEIENVRKRPCIAYLGNVVKPASESAIDSSDDLPFEELVNSIPIECKKVDVLLSTLGGSGQQIVRFVNCLRNRFDEVDFLIPSVCMSAGTLFALSGDNIWMNPNAALGPIDPQIPTSEGRFVPAQALLILIHSLQEQGQNALANNQPIPWSMVRIIDTIDKKELGDAITATQYSSNMAAEFLRKYKFKNWTIRHSSGLPVTEDYKSQRSIEVGTSLASHEKWKSHGHSISREILWSEIKLKVDHPDSALERAIRRSWAIAYWAFDKTSIFKILLSDKYTYIRHKPIEDMTNDR